MSDVRKTLGDLDTLPSHDGTEFGEYFKASNGTSYKKKLGTAAAADVTTSATDTTAGRVMRVDDYPSDTAWADGTPINGWTIGILKYIVRAGMVTVFFNVNSTNKTSDVFLTLPAKYRPATTISVVARSLSTLGSASISTNGDVATSLTGSFVTGIFNYPVIT